MKFKFLEHTADIKFQAYGKTLQDIFENSVLALISYMAGEKKVDSSRGKVIEVKGIDMGSLLYNFLDEIIYLVDAEDFITAKVKVTLRGNNLKAELYGDKASKYEINQVKAATYSEMEIKKTKDGWEAKVVLDV
ncbi:MAG: archease [Nanoarchaeota archaeon]